MVKVARKVNGDKYFNTEGVHHTRTDVPYYQGITVYLPSEYFASFFLAFWGS
jgi:hypothetical protein